MLFGIVLQLLENGFQTHSDLAIACDGAFTRSATRWGNYDSPAWCVLIDPVVGASIGRSGSGRFRWPSENHASLILGASNMLTMENGGNLTNTQDR